MTTESEPSYIDYEAFLDPDFSPYSFANTLVTTTNNPSDTPLDLKTPLSRVLFDVQEVDTHIHKLTTKSALPLLEHTEGQFTSAQRILEAVESQIQTLTEGYRRLEQEVIKKHGDAEQVRIAAENSLETLRLARGVGRCLMLGRQLAAQAAVLNARPVMPSSTLSTGTPGSREDCRALVGAAYTLVQLRRLLNPVDGNDEGYGLGQINVVRTLRTDLINPTENIVKSRAQQIINRFSLSSLTQQDESRGSASGGLESTSSFAQADGMKARVAAAVSALYLLSTTPNTIIAAKEFRPDLLLRTLNGYIQESISGATAIFSRALSVPSSQVDRALNEVALRCQNIVALEDLLKTIRPPNHPYLSHAVDESNEKALSQSPLPTPSSSSSSSLPLAAILESMRQSLDTSSLVTYFWRSLASSLNAHIQDILNHGGASARALKSSRHKLREEIHKCVILGSQLPGGTHDKTNHYAASGGDGGDGDGSLSSSITGNWEREAMVMVNAVVGPLAR
ncbi:hypothetical protein KEM54_002317 [Ascosphaera aggregata]|nr:hypothetical protein KEM54_002317 [Ascosphaera aggregata]